MWHKRGAAALILLWPLPRPFCTQMVTVGSTEKSWVGRGVDQDSRHELKEGPLTAGLNWAEGWVGRDEDNWKGWSESDCERPETGGPASGGATPAVAPAPTPDLPGPCTNQLTSNPLEWVHVGWKPPKPGPFPGEMSIRPPGWAGVHTSMPWALWVAPLWSGAYLQVFRLKGGHENQHQSGQFPWKLKLSLRHLRAGTGAILGQQSLCVEEGASPLLTKQQLREPITASKRFQLLLSVTQRLNVWARVPAMAYGDGSLSNGWKDRGSASWSEKECLPPAGESSHLSAWNSGPPKCARCLYSESLLRFLPCSSPTQILYACRRWRVHFRF